MDEPKRFSFTAQPDPTPAEIEARCQAIRATWNKKDRANRAMAVDFEPVELEPIKLDVEDHR